jgi:hypothetical protein
MLWRVENVLRSRGVGAEVKFPGYIEIKDHDHIYSPSGGGGQLAPSTRQSEKLEALGRARGMQRCGTGCEQHHRTSVCDEEICLISAALKN